MQPLARIPRAIVLIELGACALDGGEVEETGIGARMIRHIQILPSGSTDRGLEVCRLPPMALFRISRTSQGMNMCKMTK
jgi:hypothetical protein